MVGAAQRFVCFAGSELTTDQLSAAVTGDRVSIEIDSARASSSNSWSVWAGATPMRTSLRADGVDEAGGPWAAASRSPLTRRREPRSPGK